jgi:hypothetical protein
LREDVRGVFKKSIAAVLKLVMDRSRAIMRLGFIA